MSCYWHAVGCLTLTRSVGSYADISLVSGDTDILKDEGTMEEEEVVQVGVESGAQRHVESSDGSSGKRITCKYHHSSSQDILSCYAQKSEVRALTLT